MAVAIKRIILPERRWQKMRVIVSSVDYNREDDVQVDGRTMTEAHKRTFREVIDAAHEGAAVYGLFRKYGRIIDVEYYHSEGSVPEWHFLWEYYDYLSPAQLYRAHVNDCSQCASAEERARVSDHRCDVGQKLFDRAIADA